MIRNATIINQITPLIVSAGFDAIGYDELISIGALNQASLINAIQIARQLKTNIGVSVTESDYTALQDIHNLIKESNIPGVRMASSNYNNLSQTEDVAKLAEEYPIPYHRHGAWVIFSHDFQNNWDAYQNLTTWLDKIINLHYDLLLWEVDTAGTWQQNWQLVANTLSSSPENWQGAAQPSVTGSFLLFLSLFGVKNLESRSSVERQVEQKRFSHFPCLIIVAFAQSLDSGLDLIQDL
jgi:hypothetical protein